MNQEIYFKVTNQQENHHGYQYHEGLNELPELFNYNPEASCCSGGFYYTTIDQIHQFYHFGIYLREIFLPKGDPSFTALYFPSDHKWRANKVILGKRYSLADPETYRKFNLPFPHLVYCAQHGFLELIKILIENKKYEYFDDALRMSAEYGHLAILQYLLNQEINLFNKTEMIDRLLNIGSEFGHLAIVQSLINQGANISNGHDFSLRSACRNGHLEIAKFLLEKGANLKADNYSALRSSASNGHLDMVKFLIEKGSNIHCLDDEALINSIRNNHYEIAQFLIESGANIHVHNEFILRQSVIQNNLKFTQFLIKHGANIKIDDNLLLKHCFRNHLNEMAQLLTTYDVK